MLIDCGEKTESNISLISAYIDAAGGEEIDYLFLSHTDSDHTGSAADSIDRIVQVFPEGMQVQITILLVL